MISSFFTHRSTGRLSGWSLSVLFLLGACGDEPASSASLTESAAAPVTSQSAEPVETVVVSEAPSSVVTVGSQGGTLRLTENVGAVYSIAYREGGAFLEGVVLLRGKERGWYEKDIDKAPFALKNLGIGGSLGPHMVVVTPKADGVWVDDKLFVPLQDNNVALFDGAGEEPATVGLASLEPYLGPAPLEDAGQRKALVQERLRAMITGSKAINALWPAQ